MARRSLNKFERALRGQIQLAEAELAARVADAKGVEAKVEGLRAVLAMVQEGKGQAAPAKHTGTKKARADDPARAAPVP